MTILCKSHKWVDESSQKKMDTWVRYQNSKILIWDFVEKEPIFITPYFRGSSSYVWWIRKRLELSKDNLTDLKYMMTLTVKVDVKNDCQACSFKRIADNYGRFRRWMSSTYGIGKKYLTTIEPTKNGFPHYHLLMDGRYLSRSDLLCITKKWHNRVHYTRVKSAIGYVMKYIHKDGTDLSYQSFLSALKMRQFYTSRNLLISKNDAKTLLFPPEQGRFYIGTLENFNQEDYTDFRLYASGTGLVDGIKRKEIRLFRDTNYSFYAKKLNN